MKHGFVIIVAILLARLSAGSTLSAADDLVDGFVNPPDSAQPWTYWWWLDSYATKEGITRDLEEMKRQGIAGVLLFDAGEGKGLPVGPVFMSDVWRDLFQHALREAGRLGIDVGVNLCSGWDAGGTWVTPDYAAKKLVHSELHVEGPNAVSLSLPQPQVTEGYYRDIAVLAYPVRTVTEPASAGTADRKDGQRPGIKNWELKSANRELRGLPLGAQYDEYPAVTGEQDCDSGVVWTAPWHAEVSGRVRAKDNKLEIDVTNLWPNRLIGDANLLPDKQFTVTNVRKFKRDSPLLESGLLGPVTLTVAE